eukprot:COSAG04_NODE_15356_length_534_cov_1.085057_1_plen_113_part_10
MSCWLCLFVLACRNGLALTATVDVLGEAFAAMLLAVASLAELAAGGRAYDAALLVASAAQSACISLVQESGCKSAPEARAPLESRLSPQIRSYVALCESAFTNIVTSAMISRV